MPHTKNKPISLCYETHGEHGSPLLMIHGMGGSIATWRQEVIQALSAKHRVILFDNRGSGYSDSASTPYSMADLAADTVSLLDFLRIDRAHILGVSMGGMIAQHIAINEPARVRSLILACTSAFSPEHPMVMPAPEVLAQLTRPPSADPAQDIRDGWTIGYTPGFIESGREVLERILQARLAYPAPSAESLQLQFDAIVRTHDSYDRLPQIACPTLVLVGSEDMLNPAENSRTLARLIPGAQMIEYPGIGHGFLEENGEQAATNILAFLEKVDRSTS